MLNPPDPRQGVVTQTEILGPILIVPKFPNPSLPNFPFHYNHTLISTPYEIVADTTAMVDIHHGR